MVEKEKFMGYIHEQEHAKLQREERRKDMKRHSKKIDIAELRRERMRKASQRKFKWFCDRKECSNKQQGSRQSFTLEIAYKEEKRDSGNDEMEVMA